MTRTTFYAFLGALLLLSCNVSTDQGDIIEQVPPGTVIYSGWADRLCMIGADSLLISYDHLVDDPVATYHSSFIYDIRTRIGLPFVKWSGSEPIDIQNGYGLYPILNGTGVALIRDTLEIGRVNNLRDPSLNEDGSGVVFARNDSIFIFDAITNTTRVVCSMPNYSYFTRQPMWRGETIVFSADSGFGFGHIYSVSSLGGIPRQLTSGPQRDTRPRISGAYIVFCRTTLEGNKNVYRVMILNNSSVVFAFAGSVIGPEITGDTLLCCARTRLNNGQDIYLSKWR